MHDCRDVWTQVYTMFSRKEGHFLEEGLPSEAFYIPGSLMEGDNLSDRSL